jgi:hypothetical protein
LTTAIKIASISTSSFNFSSLELMNSRCNAQGLVRFKPALMRQGHAVEQAGVAFLFWVSQAWFYPLSLLTRKPHCAIEDTATLVANRAFDGVPIE